MHPFLLFISRSVSLIFLILQIFIKPSCNPDLLRMTKSFSDQRFREPNKVLECKLVLAFYEHISFVQWSHQKSHYLTNECIGILIYLRFSLYLRLYKDLT